MDWQHVLFDWNQARAFLATVEEGSLSAAGRALGLTQPTLGRQVKALEDDLGIVIFERAGASLQLTPSGKELLEQVRAMRDAANNVSLIASAQSQSIEGSVCITASDVFSVYLLPPILKQLRILAPRLSIDVVAANDIRDLQRREADIAIRHVRPEQPDLIARLLNETNAYFYASSDYLDKRGRPTRIDELRDHDFVSTGSVDRMIGYMKDFGLPLTHDNFRMSSENGMFAWELVRQGFGIAPMSELVGAKTAEVEQLLPDMEPFAVPIWLTTHRELHSSRRIRLVFDTVAEHLSGKISNTA